VSEHQKGIVLLSITKSLAINPFGPHALASENAVITIPIQGFFSSGLLTLV